MNQARVSLLVVAALIAAPSFAHAQKKKKPKPVPAAPAAPTPAPAAPAPAGGTEIDADAPGAAAAPAATPEVGTEGPAPEGGDIEAICKIDPSACPTVNLADAAKRDMNEQMYAVQQIYALRYHRFEIQPGWNFTFNDQFVSHPGPVLGLN